MKTKLTIVFLLFYIVCVNAQNLIKPSFTKDVITTKDENGVSQIYFRSIKNEDTLKLAVENNYLFESNYIIKYDKDDTLKLKKRKYNLFNETMLNIFFAEEVSSYIGESKDLSLKKSYAVLSTADKSLFLGRSFVMFRNEDTEKLTHLFTVGVKAKLEDDFSSFLSKDRNLENEIGITAKYTWIGRGIINYGCYEDEIRRLQNEIIIKNKSASVSKNVKDDTYENELKEHATIYGADSNRHKEFEKKFYENKYKSYYKEISEELIDRIRKDKLYSHLWDHYATFELFAPVSRNFYTVYSTPTSSKEDEAFYPWKINLGYTNFLKTSSGKTLYMSLFGSVFNNNTILSELDLINITTIQSVNPLNSSMISTSSAYLGDFDTFPTGSIKGEFVSYLFKKGTFGVSGALEQYVGEQYHPLNWKLGVPFSLKDKEGNPTINFELQWKEVNSEHYLGIGVGLAFGKFIN
ncbi:MAG: hypothetical protein GY739_04430 [Mesoflavibacter sp.]|nr:hypothetical protein [Mesoflavibacter sp.]